jgi:hypothetical protein
MRPTPNALSSRRCFHHGQREAVARCPECARFFCRECITEHQDRVLCAACLSALLQKKAPERRSSSYWIRAAVAFGLSLALAWFFFFALGYALLSLPHQFHEATLWKTGSDIPE